MTITDIIDQDQMFLEGEIEDWKIDLEQYIPWTWMTNFLDVFYPIPNIFLTLVS